MSNFYLPVLKTKLGELSALKQLSPNVRKKIFPLFEITPMEWDLESQEKSRLISEHLDKFKKRFASCWSMPACIDDTLIDEFNDGSFDCIAYLSSHLNKYNFNIIPVARLSGGDEVVKRFIRLRKTMEVQSICVRVTIDDSIDEDFDTTIKNFLLSMECKPEDVHFVLDLGNANFENRDRFTLLTINFLNSIEQLRSFKSVSMVGADFPPTGSIKSGDIYIERLFFQFYAIVANHFNAKSFTVNYGDYGVVSPEYFEFDPVKMSRSAIIRYTTGTHWFVAKGTKLKESSTFQQYHDLANKIISLPEFDGGPFSYGDRSLLRCARHETGPGNSTTWSVVGFNHHFTKIYSEMFAN